MAETDLIKLYSGCMPCGNDCRRDIDNHSVAGLAVCDIACTACLYSHRQQQTEKKNSRLFRELGCTSADVGIPGCTRYDVELKVGCW